MNVKIEKTSYCGTVTAPPSKSAAHRRLICAAVADGESVIHGISESEDMKATLDCITAMGAKWERDGDTVTVCGIDPKKRQTTVFPCRESGSTLRFLIPICLATGKRITLKGSKRLFERPLDIYENICREQDILFEKGDDTLTVCGKIKSGNYRIKGDVSSQFISGMLFTLPLLEGFSIIEIIGTFESSSYVDLTLDVLSKFGIRITRMGSRFIIPGGQRVARVPKARISDEDYPKRPCCYLILHDGKRFIVCVGYKRS
jgi:3-phosphoshikimate 1-carboxyvinyltransferase